MASQVFYVHLDLNKNELQNAVIQNLASAPSSPVEGQIYYDNTGGDKQPYYYDGTTWQSMGGASGVTDHGSLSGLTDDDHVQYIHNIPTTSTRNRIDLGSDVVGFKVQANGTQTSNLLDFENSSAVVVSGITGAGKFFAPGGTNALPGYTFDGDLNTGIYSDAADTVKFATNGTLRLSITNTAIDVNTLKITGVVDPTAAQDVATKAYVDSVALGQDYKDSVRVATTAAGTLATSFENTDVIDGVTLATGNRILIKDQAAPAENGIYTVNATGAPTRATDADVSADVTAGMTVWVNEGTQNGDTAWTLTTNDAITLGTTALTFVQTSGLGQVSAGGGLTKTGNTIDVVGTSNRITINADSIDIAATYVGQTSITTLGTITTGTWTGTAIAAANGGTGQAGGYTVGDILYASGASALSKLADVATGNVLISGGVATAPSWGKVALASAVSGTLPIANGGTGVTASVVNGVFVGVTNTSTAAFTAAGSQYQVFRAGASGVPAFGTINLDQSAAITGALLVANGGTSFSSYTTGDLIQASGAGTLAKLAAVATGNVLISGGVGTVSSWGKVALTTHVSGILPVANGGTNADGTTIGTANKFLHYDGTRVTATAYDNTSFATAAHNHDTVYTKVVSQTIGDGVAQTFAVTHNFNTRAVNIQVFRTATPYDTINVETVRNTVNQVTINTNNVPTSGEYTVVVIGIDG